MATRYTGNRTRVYGVRETAEGNQTKEENNGVWKARWKNIREGEGFGRETQDRRGIDP